MLRRTHDEVSAEFAPVRSLWYPTWYPGGRWQAEREAEGDATVTCGSSAPFGEPSSSLDHLDVLPRHRLLRQPGGFEGPGLEDLEPNLAHPKSEGDGA